MSFLTDFLETVPHFINAIAQTETELQTTKEGSEEQLRLLIHLAYCYSYVQLQKGVATANHAISLAEELGNQIMKGNALCARAINEFKIGYTARSQKIAQEALTIFEGINYAEGIADAHFHLGIMPYISPGTGERPFHLQKAKEKYSSLCDDTGVYMVRIQQTLLLFLSARFAEGDEEITALIKEITPFYPKHLFCFAYMQVAISMHLRQDVTRFLHCTLAWQKIAEANGNFHDFCMTKAMLPDCYRLQHINKDVMQSCLESIECAEKLGSVHGHSTVSIVMAHILSGQGQYKDALFYYQKAMDAAREIEDGHKYLMALNAAGEIYLKLGHTDEARTTFEAAILEASRVNDRPNIIAAQRHLTEIYFRQGDFDPALLNYQALFEIPHNNEGWNLADYGNYASCIHHASDTALQQAGLSSDNRTVLQLNYLQKYLELAEQEQNKREEANACKALAVYYENIADLNRAMQYYKKYMLKYEELMNEESIKNINNLRLQFESEKKEQEIISLKKEGEEALLNERLRISRELHDDIGSTLGGISIYSEVAKSRSEKKRNTEEALAKIGSTSRELIDKMSDIVWSLNPNNESFEQLIDRMKTFASMLLTPKKIICNFVIDETVKNLEISTKERKNIFLIYKEAIHNIVKYAKCKNVTIELKKGANNFVMIIKDNGKGFNIGNVTAYNGNGLKNMKSRAKDIDAIFTVQSLIDKETIVTIELTA